MPTQRPDTTQASRWGARLSLALLLALQVAGCATSGAETARVQGARCERMARGNPPSFREAVRRNSDAVVRVVAIRPARDDEPGRESGFVPLADTGPAPVAAGAQERSAASGFIITGNGQLLTSAHAVRGATDMWVLLHDGSQLRARLLGIDPALDVALLKVDAPTWLPVIEPAASERVPGDWVIAIGSPFGFEQSVTAGVVSASAREMAGDDSLPLLQTDAALNPGSSGGPILNACGQVVAMSSMIFSAAGIYMGVSFAVPIQPVMRAVALLQAGSPRTTIGVRTQNLSPALARAFRLPVARGALAVAVEDGSPGQGAGLRPGDVLLSIGGRTVRTSEDLQAAVKSLPARVPVSMDLWRDGALLHAVVRPQAEELPARGDPAGRLARVAPARLGLRLIAPRKGIPPGACVLAVTGQALVAGVSEGDCVVGVNGDAVRNPADFDQAVQRAAASRAGSVALLLMREGIPVYLPVHLGDD